MAAAVSPDRRSIAIDLLGGLWVLPDPRRRGEAHHARAPRSAAADLVARQPVDRLPGLRRRHVAHLRDRRATAATRKAITQRRVRRSRAGLVARRIAHRVLVGSLRRHLDDLGSRRSPAASSRQCQRARRLDADLVAERSRRSTFVSAGSRAQRPADIRETHARASGRSDARRPRTPDASTRSRTAMPGGGGVEPGRHDARVLAGRRTRSHVNGRASIAGADEDVFPFKPQWITRDEFIYTADGQIKRRRSLDGDDVGVVPFTRDGVAAAQHATRSRIARSSRPGRSALTGIVKPGGLAGRPRDRVHGAGRPLGAAGRRTRRCSVTNDAACRARSGVVARQHAARVCERPRRAHGSVDSRPRARTRMTQVTRRARRRLRRRRGRPTARTSPTSSTTATLERDPRSARRLAAAASSARRRRWRARTADLVADSRSVAVGALFPYSDRYREGLNQLLLYSFDPARASQSVLFPQHSAGNRESGGPVWSPDGYRMAFVTEGTLWMVPVDERGGATGPPRRDRRRISRSRRAGKATRATSSIRRRRACAASSPTAVRPTRFALDLTWRTAPPPERVVVHAGHVFDGVLEALRGESDIVIERGDHPRASRATATTCTPARSSMRRTRP